jgi:hypothetical protein
MRPKTISSSLNESDQTRVIPLFNGGLTSLNFKYFMLTATKVGVENGK